MKLQSVDDFFNQKRKTVEKYNCAMVSKLNWECPDVLYSFRGIYAIGIFVYYRKLFIDDVKTDIVVKEENSDIKQYLYSDKYLREKYPEFSDVNKLPKIKEFLEHYYDIGNVIPTWPGANVNRGMAHCYDIPNVYYKRHAKFTELVYHKIYCNGFIEDILKNDKYDTVEKLLKLQPKQYIEFLEFIVNVIIKRNEMIHDFLHEEKGNE